MDLFLWIIAYILYMHIRKSSFSTGLVKAIIYNTHSVQIIPYYVKIIYVSYGVFIDLNRLENDVMHTINNVFRILCNDLRNV